MKPTQTNLEYIQTRLLCPLQRLSIKLTNNTTIKCILYNPKTIRGIDKKQTINHKLYSFVL